MRRYKINGKKDNKKHYCPSCKAGKLFFKEQVYKTDRYGNEKREHICGVCDTRYIQSFIDMPIVIDSYKGIKINKESYREWAQSNGSSHLTLDNDAFHMIMIGNELKKVIKMENLGPLREEFEKTGKCGKHELFKSHPFRTAEGTFTIDCCPVCKLSKMEYRGVAYQDSIYNLVRYVAHMGIEYGKNIKVQEEELEGLFDVEVVKDAELSVEEMPVFDLVEEEPVW